ncbi:unnamed protein product [Cunninghamella blakesleeana]
MSTAGASFFDTFIQKESSPPLPHDSQESNSSTSLSYESNNEKSPDTPIPDGKTTNNIKNIKKINFSVYEDFLPEWQMLSESYKSQKQNLHKRIIDQLTNLKELEDRFEKMNIDFHRKVEGAYEQLSKDLLDWQEELETEENSFDREKELMQEIRRTQEERIKLNVGGQIFETSLSTLRRDPNSTLAAMFNGYSNIVPDEVDGSYFIDRDGTYFRLVLNYLRDLKVPSSVREDPKIMDELMQEARHYQINGLLKLGMANDTTKLFQY